MLLLLLSVPSSVAFVYPPLPSWGTPKWAPVFEIIHFWICNSFTNNGYYIGGLCCSGIGIIHRWGPGRMPKSKGPPLATAATLGHPTAILPGYMAEYSPVCGQSWLLTFFPLLTKDWVGLGRHLEKPLKMDQSVGDTRVPQDSCLTLGLMEEPSYSGASLNSLN